MTGFISDVESHNHSAEKISSPIFWLCRCFIVYFVSFLLIFQPFLSYADGGIVVDGSAPASQRPGLDAAQNGVPVVNITAPSAGGVSRNTFTEFNVGSAGVIMNNSLVVGVSQLGGALAGNPNFTGGQSARIILNEVTGTGRSNLAGATEIFGDKAQYVLANPNGITCNGCGFINTPRVTLSTGRVDMGTDGILRGFDVTRGDIKFEGLDVNATNLDSFDIISRTASFASSVYAGQELNVITGPNYVDYATKTATAKAGSGTAPQVGLDSSALGGMYAGKINLVATESGVGVNTAGKLGASAGDIKITADGRIEFKDANAKGNIKVASANGAVKHSGNSYSEGNTEITAAGAVELADGFTAAKGDVKINSATLDENSAAAVMAGVDALTSGNDVTFNDNGIGVLNIITSGAANNAGLLTGASVTANSGSFNNTGLIQSAGDITISASSISNLNNYITDANGNIAGGINTTGKLTLTSTSGNIDNTGGALTSVGLLTITSANSLINNSLISGSSNILINAASVDNSDSYFTDTNGYLISGILASGNIGITTVSGGINNNAGAISGNALTLSSNGQLTNDSGLANSATSIGISAVGVSNNSGGILASGDININAGSSNVSNTAGVINTSGNIDINHTATFSNTGLVSGASSIGISANSIDNSNSYNTNANGALTTGILSNGDINLTAATGDINNASGAVYGKNLTLNSVGQLDNTAGLLQATNTASIIVNGINNSSTYVKNAIGTLVKGILAASDITLASSGDINNTDGAIKSGGKITATTTGAVTNSGLVQSAGDTSIDSASLNNNNNLHADSNGDLDKGILSGGKLDVTTTGSVTNTNGALYSDDELTVTSGGAVSNTGLVASDNEIDITAASISNSGGIITDHDIALQANTGHVSNSGKISGDNIGITSLGNFDNTNGLSQSAGATTINAKGVINDDTYVFDTNGNLVKGIISGGDLTATVGTDGFSNDDGAIVGGGIVTVTTSGNFTNSGLINAANALKITAANINNSNSYLLTNGSLRKGLISQSTIDLSALSGDIVNTDGTISGGGLILTASGQLINNSLIQSTGDIDVTAASVDNSGSYAADFSKGILATGDINISSGAVDNSSGAISGDNISVTSTGAFTNDAGLVQSAGNTSIAASSIDNTNTNIVDVNGTLIEGIISAGLLTLNSSSGNIDNTGGALSSGGNTVITSSGSFINSGLVQSGGNLNITASGIDNSNSYAVTNGTLNSGLIASGTITLNAGAYDIINENGAISASKTFSLSAVNIDNNNGYISSNGVTGTSLVIAANEVNNQAGSILSKKDLTISGASGDNTAGGVISANNALNITIASGGELVNSGGDIYSDTGTITGQNINNNGGRMQAANQIVVTQTGGIFDNRGGTVLAFADGSTVTINAAQNILNQGGNIISIQNTDLNLGTAYTITGTITTGGHVDITATSITNNGIVTAGDYIELITTSGDITNNSGGQLISGTSITLNSNGSLYNYGVISGPAITITATNGGVYNYSEITSAGTLNITANNSSVNNYSRISAEGAATINTQTFNNSGGQVASNDTLTITTTGNTINNTGGGLLYATNDLNLHANTINNTSSNIFSLDGNVTLDKTVGVRNSSITNTSGTIEAFSGDVNINTNSLTNNRTSYQYVYAPARDSNGNFIYGAVNFDQKDLYTYATDGMYYEKQRWYYNIKGTNGVQGQILSGRDINLNAASTYNNAGQIAANRNITITGGSVTNQAYLVQSWEIAEANYWRGPTYWFNSIDSPGALNIEDPNYVPVTAIAASSITAGNNISGSVSNLNNATSGNGSASLSAQSANLSTSSLPGSAQVVAVNNTQLAQNQAGTNTTTGTQQAGTITTGVAANAASAAQIQSGASSTITSASSALALAVNVINNLPTGTNSLFKVNTAPGANYLIETNVAFIDQNRFLGSDYFLTRIGYTPPHKILCDALCTTKIVNQQIFEKTAIRYLKDGISTDLAQMQMLMDNAVNEKSNLQLAVGIELTATQIASLSSDIIWLVDQVIDGQHVLVPVVYLAQATIDGLSGNPANIAAGNDLTLTASNNITNSGAITAGRNLSLTAGNDITNVGGLIKAGNNVTLVSTNGDIINQAVKHTGGTGSSQIHEYIAAQGNITAGGNASLTAANDITNTASNITSTGNTTLTAGNDITIETEATRNRYEYKSKKYSKIDDVTTNTASNITTGGSFTANAGDDIAVLGSIVTAAGDASLNAGKDVNIVAVANEETHVLEISKKGFMSSSSYSKQAYDRTYQEGEVHSGSNLSITTGQNVNLVGAKVDAANNINLNAGGDVNIASVTDIHELHEKTTKTGTSPVSVVIAAVAVAGAVFTGGTSLTLLTVAAATTADAAKGTKSTSSHDSVQTTQVGSDVLAGADLTSVSTGDTTLIASALHAGGGINITSGGETSILSAKNSDYVADAATGKSLLWQSQEGAGHNDETVVHTTMEAGNGININAAGGIKVDVKNLGTVQESVAELSKQPGLEYLATLQNNPNANFTLVDEAHKAWDYKAQGLTPEGAAILTIVVAMATAGAGSSLAGLSTAGTTTASAGAGAAVGSGTGAAVGASAGAATAAGAGSVAAGGLTVAGASAAAANAAFSSLVSTAAISLANNQGDIGKTLKDLGSSDTVKSVVFAAVTAGVTGGVDPSAGIGTQAVQVAENAAVRSVAQTAIYGGNLGDALVDNLKNGAVYAIGANAAGAIGAAYKDGDINKGTQLIAHAAIGCGIGASTSGNCGAGAAGGVVGELAAEKYLAEKLKDGIKISDIPQIEANGTNFGQLAGALTAAIAGADANGIYTAAGTATNSARNNALDTLVDALQVLYDAGKIGYGKYTNDKGMVEEGYYDLASDVAAMAIPFVPAGSTKVARMLGKVDDIKPYTKEFNPTTDAGPLAELDNAKDVINSFRSGTYSEKVSDKPVTLYRAHGDDGNPLGPFWTTEKPSGPMQSTIDNALHPSYGNSATNVTKIELPSGTKYYEGISAPQGGLTGGGNQIYINPTTTTIKPEWIVK